MQARETLSQANNLNRDTKNKHLVFLLGNTFQFSGPNFFLLNNAIEWKKMGYKVTIICQDRGAKDMKFVDDYVQGQLPQSMSKLKEGQLRVIVPDANNLIPILADHKSCSFTGVTCKSIPQMTDQEIETNVSMTAECLRKVCLHDRPLKVICIFIILTPFIAMRGLENTGIPYDAVVMGPPLRFTVLPNPSLWKWILPALQKADTVLHRTEFVKQLFLKIFKNYVEQYNLEKKSKILGISIDTQQFRIPECYKKIESQFLLQVKKAIENHETEQITAKLRNYGNLTEHGQHKPEHKISEAQLIKLNLLERWLPYNEEDQTVLYVGAIMNKMGVVELVTMAPRLIMARPTLKFIFSGVGPLKQPMLQLINAFFQGDLDKAKSIVEGTDLIEQIEIEKHFLKIEKWVRDRIIFTGLLDPSAIANLMPLCTVYITPSKLSEEWNMGIIEALCYGLTPVCKQRCYFIEFMKIVEMNYPELAAACRSDQDEFFVKLPETLTRTLDFIKNNKLNKKEYKEKLHQIASDNFSWAHSAKVITEIHNQNHKQR